MGTVYRALQQPIDREVAIKILRRATLGEDGPRSVKRFFKEAKAIACLHHPHIIGLYDFGQAETGDLYLVMELLPGRSLAQVMHRSGPMPLNRCVAILDQVLDALQEAHRNQIVHRDLKPDNIQIGRRGDNEDFVTVLDFGIARKPDIDGSGSPNSTTIEVCGTPAYMSPEQILGTAVDPRSDIYSVGVLLFEMLSGQLPFDSERTIDIYLGHLKHEVPRIKDVAPHTGNVPGLQELLDRALAKDASGRFPDAGSFRRVLRSIIGSPVRATGPTHLTGSAIAAGYELVAQVEPVNTPGVAELVQQWALDIAQSGGNLHEKSPGRLVANFTEAQDPGAAVRAALLMKQRTRVQRLSTLQPLYIRVGIHQSTELATRLCEEAPRGGVVIGAECVDARMARDLGRSLRLEPAGELRIRGHRGTVKMLQVITSR